MRRGYPQWQALRDVRKDVPKDSPRPAFAPVVYCGPRLRLALETRLLKDKKGRGCPCPRSRLERPSAARMTKRRPDGEAQAGLSERMPRRHPRTSGDGAWAAPTSEPREAQLRSV